MVIYLVNVIFLRTRPSQRFMARHASFREWRNTKQSVDRYTTDLCEDKCGHIANIASGAPPLFMGTRWITLYDSFVTLCLALPDGWGFWPAAINTWSRGGLHPGLAYSRPLLCRIHMSIVINPSYLWLSDSNTV